MDENVEMSNKENSASPPMSDLVNKENSASPPMSDLVNWIRAKTKYGTPLVAAPIIILTGFCFVWAYNRYTGKKKRKVRSRSATMGLLHGGKLTILRLIDYHTAKADPSFLENAESELKEALNKELPDFMELQGIIGRLEIIGNEDRAIKILEDAYAKAEKKEKQYHEAYEIEMLLVEMLIYQGNYKDALTCKCLHDETPTDARRPLCKAIIHVLIKGSTEEARQYWNEFQEIRKSFPWTTGFDDKIDESVGDFGKFVNVVDVLKRKINNARKKTLPIKKKEGRN